MTTPGIIFRTADAIDVQRLLALVDSSLGAPRWSPSTWLKIFDSPSIGLHRIVLIAESATDCVGFGVLGLAGDEAEIESLAVAEDWRRRGIARQLCTDLLTWARARQANHASLEVRASNAAARSLYESLGFRQVGLRRRYYRDPEEDAFVMKKEL